MQRQLHKGILSAAFISALAVCPAHSGVYSQSIPSFAERQRILTNSITNSSAVMLSSHALHGPDEVQVSEYSFAHGIGTNWSYTEWYISTNDLAKQPHWDGFSEPPLSTREACALALTNISAQFPNIKSWMVVSVWLRNPLGDWNS